jgi:hypothetical protein
MTIVVPNRSNAVKQGRSYGATYPSRAWRSIDRLLLRSYVPFARMAFYQNVAPTELPVLTHRIDSTEAAPAA